MMHDMEDDVLNKSVGVEEATEAEEVQLGKVLATAMKFFNEKGKKKLLKMAQQGNPAQAMATFTFTTLKGIYDKAKASGDAIPVSVFMGENGAVQNMLEMEAQWLVANGVEVTEQTVQEAVALIMQQLGATEEAQGKVGAPEYKQEMAELAEDPAAQALVQQMGGV